MVPRYSRPAMTAIWSSENRYRIWFAIEVFAAEAMGEIGMIPVAAAIDADRFIEREAATRPARILVATVSHCHGAVNVLSIG